MLNLFNLILEDGLTPNGLYFLMALVENRGVKTEMINYHAEKRILENSNFIVDNKITDEAFKLIEKYKNVIKINKSKTTKDQLDKDEIKNVEIYRELFPKGMLPSGSPARCAVKDLEKRFVWFFNNYKYDWQTVLKATKKYINKFKNEDFLYMKTSAYFIMKVEKGIVVSTLATYCEMVLDSPDTEEDVSGGSYVNAI